MTQTLVEMKVAKSETGKALSGWNVTLTNPSNQVAFFVRLQMMDKEEEIMPAFWSGNYLTLAPGESVTVHVSLPCAEYEKHKSGSKVDRLECG